MENKKCISNGLEQKTGVKVSYCYQCGKCTAGCVLAQEMDYAPNYIIRLLQTKNEANDRRVLSSNAIWICLNCENCIARCPKEVDIPKVMDYLREEARKTGTINKEAKPVVAFHSAFIDSGSICNFPFINIEGTTLKSCVKRKVRTLNPATNPTSYNLPVYFTESRKAE